ncbi:hypothetical protein SAMN02927921_00006 [Sinomicrobium oceani]|uniref:Core-binding (CB) domain-containing protein n=1 Tax=Sinomicrobium oceani TaxID=1150368 RepID=A0A1K1LNV5_9FLAO|nr:phage integrase SAM-like domain-containing protein [Sinomicrobium oceani]SFW11326.1 hypothetical protein SAMN02927921_00006 [Sinomicrobium oceani]
MISAEIILDTRYKTKRGYPVKIRVHETGKPHRYVLLNVYQNRKKLKVDPFLLTRGRNLEDEVKYCNDRNFGIDASIEVISNGIGLAKEREIFMLQQRINELKKDSGIGIMEFFDTFISEYKDKGLSVHNYESTKNQIQKFLGPGEDMPINSIDYEWLHRFILSKKKQANKDNKTNSAGINRYLSDLRTVYFEAQRRASLGINSGNPFEGLIEKSGRRNIKLPSLGQVRKLFSFERPKFTRREHVPVMQKKIDLFLFQIAIGGHYLSELAILKWEDIKDGRVQFHRYKNRTKRGGGEYVDNKLSGFALWVIDKHGTPSDERVFSFIPHPDERPTSYATFRRGYLRTLESVSKSLEIPKLKIVTPRYLFRSIAGELLISDIIVMQLQGHSPTGVTHRYQQKIPYPVLDREHEKILNKVFTCEVEYKDNQKASLTDTIPV